MMMKKRMGGGEMVMVMMLYVGMLGSNGEYEFVRSEDISELRHNLWW